MKKLVAIAIAGMAAVALVVFFGRSAEPTVAPPIKPEQSQAPMHEAARSQELSASAMPVRTDAWQMDTPPVPVAGGRPPRQATRLTNEEQQQLAACAAAWKRKQESEQAARDAEPKDPAWAYQMEDKLREYTSQRFQSIPIEVTGIDCKTTYCDVTAQGFTPETAAEFNSALDAFAPQLRGDFQGMSVSHVEEAGKTLHVAQLKRRQGRVAPERPDADQLACMKVSGLESERERAARDAQTRDVGWADPMEQLLRQHLTAKLAKHPVERLDIVCKTSFCEIKASGGTAQSQEAFQRVSQEVGSEPWADMQTGGGGSSGLGDRWEATQTLLRRESR